MNDLSEALSNALEGSRIDKPTPLSGGASRETWSFEADGRPLILQRDRSQRDEIRLGFTGQAQLLQSARRAGVPVPELILSTDEGELGSAMIVEHVVGETIPRKILREDAYSSAREKLAAQCGDALARIHSMPLAEVPLVGKRDEVALYRGLLIDLEQPHPILELAFRWLERNRPPPSGPSVVHGDFRLGNLIVDPGGLRAVIDWELAHIGDPMEDLGWLCVKSWRFGVPDPVGGFGSRDDLFAAYEASSGRRVDPGVVRWWEVFGNIRWGIICVVQMVRHLSGRDRSVELATIGRRVAEAEHDVLLLLP